MKKLLLLLCAWTSLCCFGSFAQDANVPIELLDVSPVDSSFYSFTVREGAVAFRFSEAVLVDSSVIVLSNGQTVQIAEANTSDFFYHYYNCYPATELRTLTDNGTLQPGDFFAIKLYGVRAAEMESKIYGTDGTLAVHYKSAPIPTKLVSINPDEGSTLEQFYAPNAEAGVITFSFNDQITAVGRAYIYYGDMEKGLYAQKDVPASFEGNDVKIDLRNLDMSPTALNGDTIIGLKVNGVCSIDGQYIEGNAPGSPGCVTSYYFISKKVSSTVYGGFEGSIDADRIECWVSDSVAFDAVRFNFTLGGVEAEADIPAALTTVTPEPDASFPNALLITVDLTSMTFDAGKVTVSLLNCQTADGAAVAVSNNFTSKGRKAAATACIGITPMPGDLEVMPEMFCFSFNDSVVVEEAVRIMPFLEDAVLVPVVECNKVTFENLRGATINGRFTYRFKAKDTQGNYITYGATEGYVTAEYNVPVDNLVASAIAPEDGLTVDSLYQYTLTLCDKNDPTAEIIVGGLNTAATASLLNAQGDTVAVGTLSLSADAARRQDVVVTLSSVVVEPGTYTLYIPEMSIFNDVYDASQSDFGISWGAHYNVPMSFQHHVSGLLSIERLESDTTVAAPVYNMMGIRVANTTSRLQPGVYMIGSKKVLVK